MYGAAASLRAGLGGACQARIAKTRPRRTAMVEHTAAMETVEAVRAARDRTSVQEGKERPACPADDADGARVKARALKRALRQLAGIRYLVPGHAQLHAHVLAALRSLSPDDGHISAAPSEADLESPRSDGAGDESAPAPATPHSVAAEAEGADGKPSPAVAPAPDARYFEEDQDEQSAVLAVAPVAAFLSTIGGFSLGDAHSKPKRWRKVKKEAPPPTPEEEKRMAKVEAAAANVLKKVHDQLWSRWGEATAEQREALQKNIRRGLRHLAEPAAAEAKLVSYLCGTGNDWDHLAASSLLNHANIHEWSDQSWQHARHDHQAGNAPDEPIDSDSGESVWEEVDDEGAEDELAAAALKHLKRKRLLRRLAQAHANGCVYARARARAFAVARGCAWLRVYACLSVYSYACLDCVPPCIGALPCRVRPCLRGVVFPSCGV